jgi:hypothetical protein
MSLVLRNNLSRPLTHDELDGNLIYLNIAEWTKKGYIKGQYVLIKRGTIGIIYYCEITHTDFIYDKFGSGNFIDIYIEGGQQKRVWRQIGTGGSDGSVQIEDEGVVLIERGILNFVGPNVQAYDDPATGKTIVKVDGSADIISGNTSAGIQGTRDIKERLNLRGGGTIIIDLLPAFTFKNVNPVKATVGGIEQGQLTFNTGLSMHQTFQKIFYPSVAPTITYSTLTLNRSNPYAGNLAEIGQAIPINLVSNFTRGVATVQGVSDRFMGNPINYRYTGTAISGTITNTNSTLVDNLTISGYRVVIGVNKWTVLASYGQGQPLLYDDQSPYTDTAFTNSGTLTAETQLEGVYPVFATITVTEEMDKLPLYSMINTNEIEINLAEEYDNYFNPPPGPPFNITYPDGNLYYSRHKISFPRVWLDSRPITAIYYFNPVASAFDLAQNKLSDFIIYNVDRNINGFSVPYYDLSRHNGVTVGPLTVKIVF